MKTIKLTPEEKTFLYSKTEFIFKKKAELARNEYYMLLNGEKSEFSTDDIKVIMKGLEYTFKKKLNGFDKPMKKEVFISIKDKFDSMKSQE